MTQKVSKTDPDLSLGAELDQNMWSENSRPGLAVHNSLTI